VQNLLSSSLISINIKIQLHRSKIFPVVWHGCVTWPHILREEHKLRDLDNMVLRRIFGPKSDEITGEWRKVHNEELNDPYHLPTIFRVIKWRRMIW